MKGCNYEVWKALSKQEMASASSCQGSHIVLETLVVLTGGFGGNDNFGFEGTSVVEVALLAALVVADMAVVRWL